MILRCSGEGMPIWNGSKHRRSNDTMVDTLWSTLVSLFKTSHHQFDESERSTEEDGDILGRLPKDLLDHSSTDGSIIVDSSPITHQSITDHNHDDDHVASEYGSLYIKLRVRFPTDRRLTHDEQKSNNLPHLPHSLTDSLTHFTPKRLTYSLTHVCTSR
jgi:hypothetical protein